MASINAEKFIIDLQAKITGREEITRLQNELKKLGQVENLQKWQDELDKNTAAMKAAKVAAADLAREMGKGGDPSIRERLLKTAESIATLDAQYKKQEGTLAAYKARMDAAQQALDKFQAGMGDAEPTKKQGAAIATLTASLAAAESRYQLQDAALARTGQALDKARGNADRLRDALNKSCDPEIRRKYDEQTKAFEKAREKVAGLRQKIDEATKSLRDQKVNTQNLVAEQKRLKDAADATGTQLGIMGALGIRSFADIETGVAKLRNAWANLDKSNMGLRERFAHWTRYRERIAEAREQTNGWTTSVRKLQQGWAGVLGVIGGLRLAKVGLSQFGEFESSMLKVQALSKATGDNFELLKKQAMQLGATTRYTAAEAAAGMGQLAAAGMDAKEIYDTIPSALHMAAAAGMDVGEAADKVTNIMAQFGIQGEAAARRVADVMTVGFTGAATTMQQLSDAMVYCGPVAHALGLEIEETTAVLQSLANAGYKGEKAGTALRGGFTRLIRPMKMGREVMEQYNIQVYNTDGTLRKFADIIDDVGKSGMTTADMIKLFGQEAGPGMVALVSQGGQAIRDYEAELEKAGGEAERMAEKMESGIEGSMRRLGAAVSAVAIAFGDTFAPAVAWVADGLAKLATWVSESGETVKWWIGVLGGVGSLVAMWKMGLNTLCMALGRLGLDLAAAGKSYWNFSYASKAANLATAAFQSTLGRTALGAKLHAAGLLAANIATKTFTLATRAASFAMKALPLLGTAMLIWDLVKAFGGWIGQFTPVQKFLAYFSYGLSAAWIGVKKLWAAMTGGDVEKFDKQLEAAQSALNKRLDEIDAEAEKRRKEKEEREKGEETAGREKKGERRPDLESLDALDEEKDDVERGDDEEEAEDDPFAEPEKGKKRKRRGLGGYGEEEEDDRPDWQKLIDAKNAEIDRRNAEEERRKNTRYRVYDENGKWRDAYGESKEDVERIEREARARENSRRVVRQSNGWAQLFEGDKFVKALTAAEADAIERRGRTAAAASDRLAAVLPDWAESGRSRRGAGDDAAAKPGKVVELRLGRARLSGGERDVEDFITQLERGMATA